MQLKNATFALLGAAILLAGCSSTPVKVDAAPAIAVTAPTPQARPASATPASAVAPVVVPAYLDPKSPISTERSVYFDFDDTKIRSDYAGVLERQGRFLSQNAGVSVRIEGNTDERGGAEYNLALGQKRADAVARALKLYGVRNNQLEAVSWGKEKPKSNGHDESAWTQNRRADVVYPPK